MKRILLPAFFAALSFLGISEARAQDPQFSQFYANQVLLNPAFTGAADGPRLALNYRAQWVSIPNSYRTFAASFDMPVMFGQTRHGLGGTLLTDVAGAGSLTQVYVLVNYAYRLMLSDKHAIRLGISGGIKNASINLNDLRFPDELQSPPGSPPSPDKRGSESRTREQINIGALYYTKRFWAGVTLHNITTPRETLIQSNAANAKLPMRTALYAGYQMPIDREGTGRYAISPAIMYRMQGPFRQLDLGTYLILDPIVIGAWYRMNDAVIGLIGLRRGMFGLGYSYDYTISSLTNTISGGSHEVSLVIEFDSPKKASKPKVKMSCPTF